MRIIKHGRATDEQAEDVHAAVWGFLTSPPPDSDTPESEEHRVLRQIVDSFPD